MPQAVFITHDAGKTWTNVTGNLREASGVVGKVRPGGVLIVDIESNETATEYPRSLLVGTSSGVLMTYVRNTTATETEQHWARFGTCDEFPIVLTADLDYEPYVAP